MATIAEALFGKKPEGTPWQDREIRFDLTQPDLACRKGEDVLEYLDDVEDTKGNNGDHGELTMTNLRITWVSKRQRRTNISLGLNCISNISVKMAASRLRGPTTALHLLTSFNSQRFEFIFTCPTQHTQHLLASAKAIHAAYEASRLFRELKLRGALIADQELKLLPGEQAYSKVSGVWNLSSDESNQGSLYITNVRVVWFSSVTDSFNVSIPFLQVKAVRVCDSKFGPALVVETTPQSGGYVLGFRVEPRETLDYVHKEIQALWQAYQQQPVLGVPYTPDHVVEAAAAASEQLDESIMMVEPEAKGDAWAAYYAVGSSKEGCREPVYCPGLGLAVEAGPGSAPNVEQLWSVVY